MLPVAYSVDRWKDFLEVGGTISALLFTGLALWVDSKVRRAQTNLEITKQHRELWLYFYDRPSLAGLFKRDRDMAVQPLSEEEANFVSLLLNHLRVTFYAQEARIYVQPECLAKDIHEFLSHPAPLAVWDKVKDNHDTKFITFVEENRQIPALAK